MGKNPKGLRINQFRNALFYPGKPPMPKNNKKPASKKPNSHTSLGEGVHVQLRDAIRQGRFKPAQRIRETEVADWLKVSRTPVREAFRRLQADGLLVLTPWRGAQIAELNREQVVELYAMRKVLEGAAAGFAARYATDAEIDLLFDLLAEDEDAQGNPQLQAHLNRLFHEALHIAAHNRYLLKASNALADSLALLRSTTYEVPGRPETARQEHLLIATAIRQGKSEKGEQLAGGHIEKAMQARLALLFDE